MFERLLLCTDFSEYAIKISECVPMLPGSQEVILFHVFDATRYHIQGWTYNPEIENAKIRLEEQKQHLERLGLKVKVRLDVITSGDVRGRIVSAADEENASLVVIGARGEGLLRRTFLGSVARGVLRTTNHHTLILNDNVVEGMERGCMTCCPEMLSKIIFPTDFSQLSNVTLDILKGMEGIGTVILIHVITQGQTPEEIKSLEEETHKKLTILAEDLAKTGITTISHIRFGNPVDEILQCAKEEEVSLILLSSHGAGWLHTLLKGERSTEMVMHAMRPVLVVHVDQNLS